MTESAKRAPTPEELRRIVWRLNSEHPVDYGPDDAITQAIIALEAAADALAEREWRPIETAPKHGVIWLAVPGTMRLCWWNPYNECWDDLVYGAPVKKWFAPTHWQPVPTTIGLPSPPPAKEVP